MVWGAVAGAVAGAIANKVLSETGGDGGQRDAAAANEAIQREFAQQGVRWRVADAQAAGIHPLFALGAQLPSAQPSQFVPGVGTDYGLAAAGHDIGRAIDSTRTEEERVNARLNALKIERGELENDVLRSQLARLQQNATPPSPSFMRGDEGALPGQAQYIVERPLEVTRSFAGRGDIEPGAMVDRGFVWTGTGLQPVPGKDVKERIEDTLVPEALWSLRNYIVPRRGAGPPNSAIPREYVERGFNDWEWSLTKQEWQPVRRREVYRGPIPLDERR